MQLRSVVFGPALTLVGSGASAEVVRVGDLNTRQIRALDRDKTVVLLQGGMLEEHGPYLPAFTDGILSERLTQEIAQGVVAKSRSVRPSCFRLSRSARAATTRSAGNSFSRGRMRCGRPR